MSKRTFILTAHTDKQEIDKATDDIATVMRAYSRGMITKVITGEISKFELTMNLIDEGMINGDMLLMLTTIGIDSFVQEAAAGICQVLGISGTEMAKELPRDFLERLRKTIDENRRDRDDNHD